MPQAPPRVPGHTTFPDSPATPSRATLLTGDQRAFVETLMEEIEFGISMRPEFSTAQGYDIRRAARLLVFNGINSLNELRNTPRRNRDYLMEDLRRAGYSGWW